MLAADAGDTRLLPMIAESRIITPLAVAIISIMRDAGDARVLPTFIFYGRRANTLRFSGRRYQSPLHSLLCHRHGALCDFVTLPRKRCH